MACAIATRNALIGHDLLTDLRDRFSLEHVAGILLVSLEQVVWLDAAAFVWAVENLIPVDVLHEIRRITSLTIGKQLISQGLQPGQDFSVDSTGRLLLNDEAQMAVFQSIKP